MKTIHPTAVVHGDAQLGDGVEVGPYAIVGPAAEIGAGVHVASHAIVERCTVEAGCRIFPFAVLGTSPQTRSFVPDTSRVRVGRDTVIREYVTIQPGVENDTRIGQDCLIMAYCHVAHDCVVGDRVVMANVAQLAGHVTVGDDAVLGGLTNVHQFVRIGRRAMTGAASRVTQDVPPFCLVDGHPARLVGLNRVGLRRAGCAPERMAALARSLTKFFPADGRVVQHPDLHSVPSEEVDELRRFVQSSRRGLTTRRTRIRSEGAPGRRSGAGRD
ncbi:MAG: acyl-ACP--UDP-N-acetylglucosamine O-acyltransferase [Myxococcota bacterium]